MLEFVEQLAVSEKLGLSHAHENQVPTQRRIDALEGISNNERHVSLVLSFSKLNLVIPNLDTLQVQRVLGVQLIDDVYEEIAPNCNLDHWLLRVRRFCEVKIGVGSQKRLQVVMPVFDHFLVEALNPEELVELKQNSTLVFHCPQIVILNALAHDNEGCLMWQTLQRVF